MEEGADRTTVRARGQGRLVWNSLFQSWHSSSQQLWWPAQNQDNQHSRMGEGGASNSHSKLKSYRELMVVGERVWSLSGWPLQWMALPPCIPALTSVRRLFFKKEYMKLGGGRDCIWEDLEGKRCYVNKGYKYMIFSKDNKNVDLRRWEI